MSKAPPKECDYLVIGGGATGMAFCDTLLHDSDNSKDLSVVLVDKHSIPGGQWNDSYGFVQLHQPSNMYGVVSTPFPKEETDYRATRVEILDYYQKVQKKLENDFNFTFLGNTSFDLSSPPEGEEEYTLQIKNNDKTDPHKIRVKKKLVDARNLEPDLPISTPPKFTYDKEKVNCIPVNDLYTISPPKEDDYFVIIGGGKTSMDAILHLVQQGQTAMDRIVWIVPNDAWITARENIGNCMDLLSKCCELSAGEEEVKEDFFQNGFLAWEKQGKMYRLSSGEVLPTKFKDATLSSDELNTLKQITTIRGCGRVKAITDDGTLVFEKENSDENLPSWMSSENKNNITFVHCSAGAFACSNQVAAPIYQENKITIQDVYGTPGFCFVGAILAKIETLSDLNDDDKNALALCNQPDSGFDLSANPLGPTYGDIFPGKPDATHGWIQRALNLYAWLEADELRSWLFPTEKKNRLFNLRDSDASTVELQMEKIIEFFQNKKILPSMEEEEEDDNDTAKKDNDTSYTKIVG